MKHITSGFSSAPKDGFFKPEDKKQPIVAINYGAWENKTSSTFYNSYDVIKRPELKKSISVILSLEKGLVLSGSSDILQLYDNNARWGCTVEHTHCSDLCLWDLDEKKLISQYVSDCGGIEFLLKIKKNWILVGSKGYKSECYSYLELIDFTDLAQPKRLYKVSLPKDCWINDLVQMNGTELGILLYASGVKHSLFTKIDWTTLFTPHSNDETISRDLFIEVDSYSDQLFLLNNKKIVIVKSIYGGFDLYNWETRTLENELSFSSTKYDVFTPSIQLKNGQIVNLRTLERDDKEQRSCLELYFWDLTKSQPLIKVLTLPCYGYVRGTSALLENASGDILITPDDDSDRIIQVTNKDKINEFRTGSSLSRWVFIHDAQKLVSKRAEGGFWFHNIPVIETTLENKTPVLT